MNTKETDPEKYYWAHRELQAIVKNNDREKLANWMTTHKNHAYIDLREEDQLKITAENMVNFTG